MANRRRRGLFDGKESSLEDDEEHDGDDEVDDHGDDEGGNEGAESKLVEKPPAGWITRGHAARKLGCHPNRVLQMERNGELTSVTVKSNGYRYYDPMEIEEIAEGEREMKAADLLGASSKIIQQQMKHTENVMRMATDTAQKLLEVQGSVIKELRERNALLESGIDQMKDRIDEADSKMLDRELEQAAFMAAESRKQRTTNAILSLAPAVLPILMKFLGKTVGMSPAEQTAAAAESLDTAAAGLLSQIEDEQIAKIWQSGILTSEQMKALTLMWTIARKNQAEAAVSNQPSALGQKTETGNEEEPKTIDAEGEAEGGKAA